MSAPVYLDHNATTAPAPEAVQAMVDVMGHAWANASSIHAPGQAAKRVLADARATVARALGCLPVELVFTSGATESNHMAVHGALARGLALGRKRLLLSAVEHPGLLALAARLREQGTPVDIIPVDAEGRLDMAQAWHLMGPDVALLSVMGANNETGVVMPVAALAAAAHEFEIPVHVDATQCVGKLGLRFDESGADLWSVSAHKLHGPKGVGALIVRKGLTWPALLVGSQERRRRGGTENLPGIAGFAAAAERMAASLPQDLARMAALRDRLEAALCALAPEITLLGAATERLPNTCCLRVGEIDAERVLDKLERAGVIASSGSACSAGGTEPSPVLLAMGCTPRQARAGVRLSLGPSTTDADIDRAIDAARQALTPLLAELRSEALGASEQPAPVH